MILRIIGINQVYRGGYIRILYGLYREVGYEVE